MRRGGGVNLGRGRKHVDEDRIKGAADDMAGRVKRQVGEWTGDKQAQAEGAAQQVKGKAEKAVGKVKDTIRNADKDTRRDDPDRDVA